MKKKIDLNDYLNKLTSVFKNDAYIYKYQYCIGGPKSEEDNSGKILCINNPEYIELIKTIFPNKELIFFSDIKKAKKEPEIYIKFISNENEIEEVKNNCKFLQDKININNKWENLILSDDDINKIFIDRKLILLFENNSNLKPLYVSKDIFPLLNEKKINDVEIMLKSFKIENDINSFLLSYSTEVFQINEYITYIELT